MELKESDDMYMASFTRGFIFEQWLPTSGSDIERRRQVLQYLIQMVPNAENVDTSNLNNVVTYICNRILVFWKSSGRKKCAVLKTHADWFSEKQNVNLPKVNKKALIVDLEQPSSSGPLEASTAAGGRPKKDFLACSKRSKRRRLAALASFDESAVSGLTKTTSFETHEVNPDDVLSLLTEAKLTKHQYLLLRTFINSRVNPILPSYGKVIGAKKKCYPDNIIITESTAEVELQSLLDHTASRIIEFQKEVIAAIPEDSMGDVTLIGKWGFDGSTGQSEYKQKFASSDVTADGSLFVTSYVPLRLISTNSSSDDTEILWKNPRPSSTRYCRPIRFQFNKGDERKYS